MRTNRSCRHKRVGRPLFSEWRHVRTTQITPHVATEPTDLERPWYSSFTLHLFHHMSRSLIVATFVVFLLYGTVSQYQCYVTGRCFHHELFHLLENAMGFSDITKYDELAGFERDPEWEELNDERFRYDPRWRKYYSRLEAKAIKPGIWTYYSMSSPAEDKAVLFSYMVNEYDKLWELSKKDEPLERKISLLRRRLFMFDAFFDESLWLARAREAREKRGKTRAGAFHLTNGACAWSCTWCRRVSTNRPLDSCSSSSTIVSSCSTRGLASSSGPRAARSSRSMPRDRRHWRTRPPSHSACEPPRARGWHPTVVRHPG
jgi:hypothetical protein